MPAVLAFLLMSGQAIAAQVVPTLDGGINLSQTRVVFLSTDKAQTLTVKNSGAQSYLIQSRVQGANDDTAAPFVVTPPLFVLKSGNRQLLRIIAQGAALPTDRESLFHLAVLAIPGQADKEQSSVQLSVGIRFVLKLFYRPAGLKTDAGSCSLRLSQETSGVRVENPTPYFQTLGQLMLNQTLINLDAQPSMLAPMSTQTYSFSRPVTQASWQTITDFGGMSSLCEQTVSSR